MSSINITNLKKEYNSAIVLDIPLLNIKQGEIIGIVGNNGAGKTTLFRLILDLIEPTAGTVKINGIEVAGNDRWKATTGAYLDDKFLIKFLTAKEFLSFIGSVYKLSNTEINNRIMSFNEFMTNEITCNKKYIHEFSSGNKQKIGIVSAMITHPDLLILDEPFNFLDPSSQIIIKKLLLEYNQEYNTTILLSSHNIQYVMDICSRVIVFDSGYILYDESDITKETKNKIESYFSKINS
ncbi:MAG: ABC transporter ATP-binding protein [Tannerellaceae bacterium]|jgi:ABC-2 type transport system ATP-binding protein|nr:ABC transporter ATP-binding protein [Tannerellaceae bacterium]